MEEYVSFETVLYRGKVLVTDNKNEHVDCTLRIWALETTTFSKFGKNGRHFRAGLSESTTVDATL